jgi:hypothetical protein
MDIYLLSKTIPDTTALATAIRQLTKQNIAVDTGSPIKDFLVILAKLNDPAAQATRVLESPGHLLRHVHYSLMVLCSESTILNAIRVTPLAIETLGEFAVLSGDLECWRGAIINSCSEQAPYQVRALFNDIMLLFEREGLRKLWGTYYKKDMPDQTFKLLETK